MTLADNRWVIVDTETFGLDPREDPIIEVGFLICTLDFEVVTHEEFLLWENGLYDQHFRQLKYKADAGDKDAELILKMHTKSGLFDDARGQGAGVQAALEGILEWLTLNQITDSQDMSDRDPMVGSTIDFDRSMLRAQMPSVDEQFHYRSVNISSFKETCRRYSPHIYEKLNPYTAPRKAHRVYSDCIDSMKELQFYVDNFIWTE